MNFSFLIKIKLVCKETFKCIDRYTLIILISHLRFICNLLLLYLLRRLGSAFNLLTNKGKQVFVKYGNN